MICWPIIDQLELVVVSTIYLEPWLSSGLGKRVGWGGGIGGCTAIKETDTFWLPTGKPIVLSSVQEES